MCARKLHLDHYSLLNIDSTADGLQVRKAYRQAALRAHPDKGGTEELFHRVAAAFEILSCPSSRAIYNRELTRKTSVTIAHLEGKGSTPHASRKRPRSSATFRRCASRQAGEKKKARTSQAESALESVRSVLQYMSVSERHRALTSADCLVKVALLSYMKRKQVACAQPGKKTRADDGLLRSSPCYGRNCVRTISRRGLTTYQAMAQIRTMRLYTREQSDCKAAIEHQMILISMRQAVSRASAAKPQFWSNPQLLSQACSDVLVAHGKTESELGLRVIVRMRASQWLGTGLEIRSPATSLGDAAALQAPLLQARASSWEAFRAEWVHLMLSRKNVCLAEAKAIADKARADCLRERFTHVALCAAQEIKKHQGRRGTSRRP